MNREQSLSFFTFATGKKYLDMAFALARSYRYHNGTEIPFYIASVNNFRLPPDLHWVRKIFVDEITIGPGLEFKLHLIDIAPTEKSIFIDADSLIYSDVSFLFNMFNTGQPSVIGLKVTEGEWVDEDIKAACLEFGLDYVIRYCGALYYLIKNTAGKQIFDYAMSLHQSTRRFQRNEKTIYDEPIMALALSKYRVEPLIDDGNIWGDLVHFNRNAQLNVFKGPAEFINIPGSRTYKFWLPQGSYRSKIMHVGSGNHNKKPWLFDAVRLKLYYRYHLPLSLADALVNLLLVPMYDLGRHVLRK
jgi:hypothetical protein